MSILAVLVAVFTGFVLVRLVWPNGLRWCRHDLLRVAVGAGAGLAISSLICFLIVVLAAGNRALLIGCDVAVAAALAAVYWVKRRNSACPFCASAETVRAPNLLWGAAALAVATAAGAFAFWMLTNPTGEWDAWSIWNLHARFLAVGGAEWTNVFARPDCVVAPGISAARSRRDSERLEMGGQRPCHCAATHCSDLHIRDIGRRCRRVVHGSERVSRTAGGTGAAGSPHLFALRRIAIRRCSARVLFRSGVGAAGRRGPCRRGPWGPLARRGNGRMRRLDQRRGDSVPRGNRCSARVRSLASRQGTRGARAVRVSDARRRSCPAGARDLQVRLCATEFSCRGRHARSPPGWPSRGVS